ncbi:hypothetical protein [uncultured Arcticibacterium sp.]|uniref:hypothetical protein n=1 Tax=uncultured Arcticibacterium sp. TaxID=2173042 RepID=UPI0030F7679D
MKNTFHFFLLVITLLLISLSSFSQSNEKPVYPRQLPVFNVLNVDTLIISAKVTAYETFEITLDNINDEEPEKVWILRPFTLQAFRNTFRDYLFPLTQTLPKASIKDSLIDPIFFNLKASDIAISSYANKPNAGNLCFNRDAQVRRINLYEKNSKLLKLKAQANLDRYKFAKTQVVINETSEVNITDKELYNTNFKDSKEEILVVGNNISNSKLFYIGGQLYKKKKAKNKLIETYREDFLVTRQNEYDITKFILDSTKTLYSKKSKIIAIARDSIVILENEIKITRDKIDSIDNSILSTQLKIDSVGNNLESMNRTFEVTKIPEITKLLDLKYRSNDKKLDKYKEIFVDAHVELKNRIDDLKIELDYTSVHRKHIEGYKSEFQTFLKNSHTKQDSNSIILKINDYKKDSLLLKDLEINLRKQLEQSTYLLIDLNKHFNLVYNILAGLKKLEKSLPQFILSNNILISNYSSQIIDEAKELEVLTDELIQAHEKFINAQNKMPETDFAVNKIDIEFNKGFIENILVLGEVINYKKTNSVDDILKNIVSKGSKEVKFENLSPIGFSRKIDFEDAKNRTLHTRGGNGTQYEIRLEDILTIYVQNHQVDRRDFSPMSGMVTYSSLDIEKCKPLFKEETYKIIEATIFSDFVGLDKAEPNGLVQTEISKNIPLITSRNVWRKVPTLIHGLISSGNSEDAWNFGILAYFEPILAISKVEDDNKTLTLNTIDRFINNSYSPVKYTSTLKLKQFQNFETGFDLNLFLVDMPSFKSTFTLDLGSRFGRTLISDTLKTFDGTALQSTNGGLPQEYGVNTYEISHKLNWNIKSDERYEFNLSWRKSWLSLRDNRFSQVGNIDTFGNTLVQSKHYREYHTMQMQAKFKLSNTASGKLFFRYRLHWQRDFWRTGFHQAQVGYSFFLLGRYKE